MENTRLAFPDLDPPARRRPRGRRPVESPREFPFSDGPRVAVQAFVPRDLREELKRTAEQNAVSLNQLVNEALRRLLEKEGKT